MAAGDVVAVKREIVGLMITAPQTLQVQLGEAISIIAESDFWERWDTLIDVDIPTPCPMYDLVTDAKACCTGSRFPAHTRQSTDKQRRSTSCTYNLQTLETAIPFR